MTSAAAAIHDDTRARRNAIVLSIAQALSTSSTVVLIATAGTHRRRHRAEPELGDAAGIELRHRHDDLDDSRLAAHAEVRAQSGFVGGALIGLAGAVLSIVSIYLRDFGLFVLSTALHGSFAAAAQYYRFAAADDASPDFRPKAISWVLVGGVAAALFGTLIVMNTVELLAPILFAGCYVATAMLAVASIGALLFLETGQVVEIAGQEARPLSAIIAQPRFIAAVVCGMMSFGMMNLVMTATPIAMFDCGFSVGDASWVIQWHVLGMYVPSFFTGSLIARFGVERITGAGMVILAFAGIGALAGIHFANFAVALVLLGIGWNFGYIGGTTMVTECYRPSERNKVQAVNDFAVFTTVAIASLTSGKLLDGLGWNAVNLAIFPMVAVGLGLLLWYTRLRPQAREVIR